MKSSIIEDLEADFNRKVIEIKSAVTTAYLKGGRYHSNVTDEFVINGVLTPATMLMMKGIEKDNKSLFDDLRAELAKTSKTFDDLSLQKTINLLRKFSHDLPIESQLFWNDIVYGGKCELRSDSMGGADWDTLRPFLSMKTSANDVCIIDCVNIIEYQPYVLEAINFLIENDEAPTLKKLEKQPFKRVSPKQ
jgi:hypothetical protein